MGFRKLRKDFEEVAFTTAVPFTDDGSEIRYDALENNITQLYEDGARLFVPCGNTGEYHSLTTNERINVVEHHINATGKDATVVGGAAGSIENVKNLSHAYEDVGADAVMVMHPPHTHIHEAGLAEYYHRLCDQTDLGVVIYKRGSEVTRNVLSELSERANLVAVKFAVNDIKEFTQTVKDVPGEVTWVNGIAERYAVAFAVEGATGYTTGVGNFIPQVTLALQEALVDEDWDQAKSIQQLLRPFEDLREESGEKNTLSSSNNVPVVKYGMDLAGYTGGAVRAPLSTLSEDDKHRVEEYFDAIEKETNTETGYAYCEEQQRQ